MRRLVIVLLVAFLLATMTACGIFQVFDIPTSAQLISVTDNNPTDLEQNIQCKAFNNASNLDNDGDLTVLVWNIYKQKQDSLYEELEVRASDADLSLLQEVYLDDEYKKWLFLHDWVGQQVNAFESFEISSGVFNISKATPSKVCAEIMVEPWLQLPKSALFALYPLSSGQQLAVANLHSINFTFGTEEFKAQLSELKSRMDKHNGPILFAGDFNSWSKSRMRQLTSVMATLGLSQVTFEPDHRKKFITGLALDHVFYRDMKVKRAEAPLSDASDHNPLIVEFSLN
jgi:endonuclease/exonuclease/phosphatase (EEP) superfamily protein YafD